MTTTAQTYFDNESVLFTQRQLTRIRSRIYEREYPMLKMARGEILPISVQTEAQFDDFIECEEYDTVGMAAVITDYSDGGPTVGVVTRRVLYRIRTVGDKAIYNWEEINKARFHNKPLREQNLRALREAADKYLNEKAYLGDPDYGLTGIMTTPGIPRFNSATRFADTASTADLLALLDAPISAMMDLTNGQAMPRKWVLPELQFRQVYSTYRATGSDLTVADSFLNAQSKQGLINQFVCDQNLKGLGDDGSDVGLILPEDEDKICLAIQRPFEILPEQQMGLEFIVHALMRTSLVQCLYPLESMIVQGI